jgi:hypothetical protein
MNGAVAKQIAAVRTLLFDGENGEDFGGERRGVHEM